MGVDVQWDSADPAGDRRRILKFLEAYCRDGMTLHEAREWYADAFALDARPVPGDRDPVLNVP